MDRRDIRREAPQPGQESVWDYPRPPACRPFQGSISVVVCDIVVASATDCVRVLETSHPPVYYVARDDINMEYLRLSERASWCEWKGQAVYFDLHCNGRTTSAIAWSYPEPTPAFASIRDHLAFYPGRVDACFVNGEQVQTQAGDFYGGWITSNIVGPFKGSLGTTGW